MNAAVAANAPMSVRKQTVVTIPLNATQATTMQSALADDAQDYYYSACVSVVDALRGLHCGFYTWATVKLYYSVFYTLRAALAADKVCVFYIDEKTPFSISAAAGRMAVKGSGNTHEFVLALFTTENPGHKFVVQSIDLVPPLKWLVSKRIECNYRIPRFAEPEAPKYFQHVESKGVRRLVEAYLADTSDIYTFDKEHAMLALPLNALVELGKRVKGIGGVRISTDELAMMTSECCDDAGPLSQMVALFEEFSLR